MDHSWEVVSGGPAAQQRSWLLSPLLLRRRQGGAARGVREAEVSRAVGQGKGPLLSSKGDWPCHALPYSGLLCLPPSPAQH